MEAIASLAQDDPYLKLSASDRRLAFKARRARFDFKPAQEQPAVQIAIVEPPAPVLRVRRAYETAGKVASPVTWRIMRVVSEEFDMPVSDITSRNREPEYTLPRYVAIGLMLELTDMSLPAIGRRLGGRDHTTIINGRKRLEALLAGEAFRNRFDQIKAAVLG